MIPNVKAALDTVLGSAATLRNAGGAGRAFELFVMTGIARELQVRGYDVWLQRSDGSRIRSSDSDRRFIQRGGAPTGIAGSAQGAGNASVISFQWPGRVAWEIWNGVQFEGRSGARHEIDIAIVPAGVGQALRAMTGGGVATGRPRIAIECKDVKDPGSIDEMRAFVARLYDLTLLQAHHAYLPFGGTAQAIHPGAPSGSRHRPVITYWIENRRTKNIVARKAGFVPGAAAMTSYHSVEPHAGITVGSPNTTALIGGVASWIVAQGY
ncbi:hypothetical protein QM467_01450 [Rhodoblastus sp. 17X3]|uniref:hypothetical protein n=1 Tax=Rhodoblastus sp. 17X3 TaxID=3047026 RepID=UPI0024B6751B|nr:hypothetical protein [Rhodoblastus sp. 17X3]MDI9846719.1 hypothetical protein [Rhodoblastus sp. 17X3]